MNGAPAPMPDSEMTRRKAFPAIRFSAIPRLRDRSYRKRLSKCSGRRLGLCGQRLPELNLIPIRVIDPGKATVGFIHSFGVNLLLPLVLGGRAKHPYRPRCS